ncbi:MAG: LacI family DNA-binding transcriptional regulator [Oscillospiraceae bacterium]|nr:LacI family DNA-binding transcriptional regulator [Oscillospiraceae bacterium]
MNQKTNLTIDDIARELGVSKTTVSRAISGKGRISSATRERVQAYIQECNYRPSAAAKSLAESRTYNLALVLPRSFIQLDLPYMRKSLNAICEEAFLRGYYILLCLSIDDNPDVLLRTLDNRKVDGVILARTVENDILVDILHQRGIPFSTMGSLPPRSQGFAVVETDHDQISGCHDFTKTFLQSGSGKVALLGNDMHYIVNQSRLAGFNKAVQELNFPASQIALNTGLNSEASCESAVDELLAQGFHRFLAMDDDICLWTLSTLNARGISIPDQVQIGSLCDSDLLAISQPPVSALQFDAAELGRVACRELLRCLLGEEYEKKPVLGYQINMREST